MMRSVAFGCCNLKVDLEGQPLLRSHPDTVMDQIFKLAALVPPRSRPSSSSLWLAELLRCLLLPAAPVASRLVHLARDPEPVQ